MRKRGVAAALAATAALLVLADTVAARQRCPERISLGYGETVADIARRCGVSVEAIERFNPGLDRNRPQQGVHVTVPRPPLPSPAIGNSRNAFVPVPTPPGALGR